MKLISCHIENFGKLSDYKVDFQENQTIICEDNGWGKSTFAAFVRSMFYGLEGERKRSIEENERKRYKPWQGGTFGGKLTFEVNGKRYVMTRVFGEKEQNDFFELRDAETNILSQDYSSNVGKELFQIDRASFVRTAFVGQNEIETASTDDINAKIGNLVDNSNDLNSYEKASAKLTEIMNSMTPKRATGSIAKRTNKITELERLVQSGASIADAINQNQELLQIEMEHYEKKVEEKRKLEAKQVEVSKMQTVIAKRDEWKRLQDTKEKRTLELAEIREYFPKDVPNADKIKEILEQCIQMDRVAERVKLYALTDKEKLELEQLSKKFSAGTPDKNEIDRCLSDVQIMNGLKQETAAEQMSKSEQERLLLLEKNFAYDTESINSLLVKWSTRNTKKSTLPSNQAALSALETAEQTRNGNQKLSRITILGFLLLVLGLIFVFVISSKAGVVTSVAAVACVILGIINGKKEKKESLRNPQIDALKKLIEEDDAYILQVDEEVEKYLNQHDKVFVEHTVTDILQEISLEQVEYRRLKEKSEQCQKSNKLGRIEEIRISVATFLDSYGVSVTDKEFAEALHFLSDDAKRYGDLCDKQISCNEAREVYLKQDRAVREYLKDFGWDSDENLAAQVREIQEKLRTYENYNKLCEEANKEMLTFEKEADLSWLRKEVNVEEMPSLDELNQKLQGLSEELDDIRKRKQEYNRILESLQEQYEEWEENKIKLEEQKVLQQKEKEKYTHISNAKKYLGLAKESMTSKYVRPIFESFSRYYKMIAKDSTEQYHINANAEITVEEHGVQRETNALSAGYKDLIGLCLRIALVDAMYQDELPMLILDDPFVNLDDKKVEMAKKFLDEIAKKYQVIYFTCSEGRR